MLITALAIFKLWGWRWGLLALITFVLTFPESGAPRWVWLALVLAYALLHVLKAGKIKTLVRIYQWGTIVVLIAMSIPFMVQQLRVGIYPALEKPYEVMEGLKPPPAPRVKARPMSNLDAPAGMALGEVEADLGILDRAPKKELRVQSGKGSSYYQRGKLRKKYDSYLQKNLQDQRPGTKVQTGPGLPRWQWNSYAMEWNGPVEKIQEVTFILMPPWLNLILAFVRVGLLAALILGMMGISRDGWNRWRRSTPALAGFLLVLISSMLIVVPAAQAADYPSQELLDQLRERLLEPPECSPRCAAISRMELAVSPQTLQARLLISVDALTAVPLPGSSKEWSPQQVSLNGAAAPGLSRDEDGQLWLVLSPGVHQVTLQGPLPAKESVSLPLPLRPYFVAATISGWSLEGLHDHGIPDSTLQLTRHGGAVAAAPTMAPGSGGLMPFLRVERELVIGLQWEVLTRVIRVTPLGTPVILEVPLLPGESVITSGIRVEDGKAQVNMAPNAETVEWRSVLKETDVIELVAPDNINYLEVWKLNVSPVWHVVLSGIPMIHAEGFSGTLMPEWRPWPGESVGIQVSRPEGIAGQTLTIDYSRTKVVPGIRYTQYSLDLTLRSSLGGQHVMSLPEGAELQEVQIDGKVQPIRLEAGKVTIPLVPGTRKVQMKWQQSGGVKTFFRVPEINLGAPSVNGEVQIRMPKNRWVIFTWGPRMGPAVLFWALLIVLLLVAFFLSRLGWTPLRTVSWFLLGIGITQFPFLPVRASIFVAAWLLALGWRQNTPDLKPIWFDLRQIGLVSHRAL